MLLDSYYAPPLSLVPQTYGIALAPQGISVNITPFGAGIGGGSPLGLTPSQVEAQAQADFVRVMSTSLLTQLASFVQQNVQRFPQLKDLTPLMARVFNSNQVGDYQQALSDLYTAYRAVSGFRASQPDLPRLGAPAG